MAKTIDGKEFNLYVVTWDQAEGWDESFIAYLEEPYKGRWEGPLQPLLPLPEMRRLAAYNRAAPGRLAKGVRKNWMRDSGTCQPRIPLSL